MDKHLTGRRVPEELRKRTSLSCDPCRKRSGIPCVSNYQRKTRLYGSHDCRIQCLEAIVKGAFPGARVDSIPALLELGRTAGYSMPQLNDHSPSKANQLVPRLVQDSRGHSHYIGPSGSLSFFADLRSLISERQPSSRFAADTIAEALEAQNSSIQGVIPAAYSSPEEATRIGETAHPRTQLQGIPKALLQRLVDSFFQSVNDDFPLLDRGYFYDKLECYVYPDSSTEELDHGWAACIHTAVTFGCWIADGSIRDNIPGLDVLRSRCWNLARGALPDLLTSCTVSNIQALLLMALLLHNNNDRNAAWTLTGSAVRLAIALGLHRSDVNNSLRLVERETRTRVWYTLFAFEQFLCLSLGRPSAIDAREVALDATGGDISGSHWGLPQYTQVAIDLQRQTSTLRDAISFVHRPPLSVSPTEPALAEPITILDGLKTWESTIPKYLTVPPHIIHAFPMPSATDLDPFISRCPPSHLRPMILLHINYHNLVIQLSRPYLLAVISASRGSNPKQYYPWAASDHDSKSPEQSAGYLARTCVRSASCIINLLILLESAHAINGTSGLDLFYGYSAGMVLLLRRLWVLPLHSPKHIEELEGTAQHQVQSMVAKLQSVVETQAQCPTMQRFKAVLLKFDEAVMANARPRVHDPSTDTSSPFPLPAAGRENYIRAAQTHSPFLGGPDGDPDTSFSDNPSMWQESMRAVTQYSLDWSNFEQFLGSLNVA
ncbi:hypothetical protein ASPCADRAFT_145697 [Aspergillus carbonarius ITEM 5010]|uniref:Xylanolytic transcriptional activator regulatory domain-containing protein n=1 Tax=Aspergillus carbonarius (strain ITEM 5010) TaxID=602072 RepID=A0A1R3RQX4_ASPC5|nr:hypothetical protein ASPCADRAFT_145697 [Aspergillus carbonarius ITEM 5010]